MYREAVPATPQGDRSCHCYPFFAIPAAPRQYPGALLVAPSQTRYTERVADDSSARPQVLVAYPGPDGSGTVQDIFVYLRPETNGVLVESALLRVIQSCSQYRSGIKLVYLANYPGQFIIDNHIVERHYAHKFFFAVHGKRVFTPRMKEEFEKSFGISSADAPIIGSFEALHVLEKTPDELFTLWVPPGDIVHVDGQTIKRYGDVFIVNYDIPALLHKNTRSTDIAVMLFRCAVDYDYFVELVNEMRTSLVRQNVLSPNVPVSRAFHYSKGPVEQLLDATDYLRRPDGEAVRFDELSFAVYAQEHDYGIEGLAGVVHSPICLFEQPDGTLLEENIFSYTASDSYADALKKLRTVRAQLWIR